ncbi:MULTISPECIES: hypothetical protein [unclassified Pedobacter]|uniref:hypothetical protein n=1 Tax=unclassified Pedobacter TaxID=2628915 RepID=UPI001D724F3D|nr:MULTISPECIES: hypothetical protein [unclassified Pedobacter]CAH0277535.1 hypothetical protein SRABI36_03923 [Pedobacter sp. Bi36]CAH0294574.1 hypothetical protein SRABI126_04161 [Pedobacter sp. Bi126]
MNFKFLIIFSLLSGSSLAYAQNTFPPNGAAGIGTLTPDAPLQIFVGPDSKPAGVVSAAQTTLKLSRFGTGNYSYNESAEFRVAHGGPYYWGSRLDLYVNGANNQSNVPDQHAMTWQYNGNVGIGTNNPMALLQLGDFNSSNQPKQVLIPGNYNFERLQLGQLGNGNSALEMVNHNSVENSYGIRLMANIDNGGPGLQFQYAKSKSSYEALEYQTAMFLDLNGQIGIGTLTPREKLSVNGNIRAKEIKVESANWPDYVFEEGYNLGTLKGLESYIKTNKHLPGMPTTKEIVNNGLELGEMVRLQQEKIEELTLHLIEKEKAIEKEALAMKVQQAQIEGLKKGYLELKQQLQLLIKQKK